MMVVKVLSSLMFFLIGDLFSMSSQAHRMYSKDSLSLISYFLQDRFSVLLEYDYVSERSLFTNILSNGGSFYKSSHAHTMCSKDSLSLIS